MMGCLAGTLILNHNSETLNWRNLNVQKYWYEFGCRLVMTYFFGNKATFNARQA